MLPSRPSVILVAHGSTVSDGAHEAAEQHAMTLRQSNRYGNVDVCFLTNQKEMPDLPLGEVFLLPYFMSDGYFVTHRIPALFKLSDGRKIEADRSILQCDALGVDPQLADIIIGMGTEVCAQQGEAPLNTHLILVAHGSEKSKASADATFLQQRAIEKKDVFGTVSAVFLNEEPELENWLIEYSEDNALKILVGLFAAKGPHAMEDVPNAMRNAQALTRSSSPMHYAGVVGTRPEIVKLIQESISRCAASNRERGK